MSYNRLDWLYAQKPVPTQHVYLDLVGRELYEMCQALPMQRDQVEFLDAAFERRFADALEQMRPASSELMLVLADLLQWEIEREFERVDDFMRNERYRAAAGTELAVQTMHFMRTVLLERLLERQELSSHKVRRVDLLRAVESFRKHARYHVNVN